MKRLLGVPFIVGVAVLCACTPQQQTQTQNSVDKGTAQARVQLTNGALEVRVSAAIASQAGLNAFQIGPKARDGVVTLTGTVPSATIHNTVIQTVQHVPGVKRVVDQIRVK
jgi:hyperosmotically inducible protein